MLRGEGQMKELLGKAVPGDAIGSLFASLSPVKDQATAGMGSGRNQTSAALINLSRKGHDGKASAPP